MAGELYYPTPEQLGYGNVISTQPNSIPQAFGPVGAPGGSGPVTVRNLIKTKDDCDFAARLTVLAFREKFVHATSENSLPKVINALSLDFQVQDPIFFQRHFIAEYNGQKAGLLVLAFNGDPASRTVDEHYSNFGCCDICGLCCMDLAKEDVPHQKCYIAQICVDESYRGKGIGKVLMERAEYEARMKHCSIIYLHVHTRNRAMHLYERQGFRVKYTTCCCGFIWCMMGIWKLAEMEKRL